MKLTLTICALSLIAGLTSARSAGAAVIINYARTPDVSFANGTADVIDIFVTGFTGLDATPGSGGPGASIDPEILALTGTFTIYGPGAFATPGAATGPYAGKRYDNAGGAPQVTGVPSGYGSSFVNLPTTTGSLVRTGLANAAGSKTSVDGTCTSFSDSWYVAPVTTGGPGGGVEPGQDPYGTGINGLLMQLLITPDSVFTFAGSYADYGYSTGNVVTLNAGFPGRLSTVALTPTPEIGLPYGPTLASLTLDGANSNSNLPVSIVLASPAATGMIAATGFNGGGAGSEIFALKLSSSADDAAIAAAINADSNTVSASVLSSTFALFSRVIIDLILTGDDPALNGDSDFGFNFTFVAPGVTLTEIAAVSAVPEPGTMPMSAITLAGLLRPRRHVRCAPIGEAEFGRRRRLMD